VQAADCGAENLSFRRGSQPVQTTPALNHTTKPSTKNTPSIINTSAGENEQDIWPTIKFLQANGVRAIVDFAAEDDVDAAGGGAGDGKAAASSPAAAAKTTAAAAAAAAKSAAAVASATNALSRAQGVVGRVYRYEDEAACDRHVGVFKRAIETAGTLPGPGFAAIKVTALGNPLLLERVSGALLQVRELFAAGDTDGEWWVRGWVRLEGLAVLGWRSLLR